MTNEFQIMLPSAFETIHYSATCRRTDQAEPEDLVRSYWVDPAFVQQVTHEPGACLRARMTHYYLLIAHSADDNNSTDVLCANVNSRPVYSERQSPCGRSPVGIVTMSFGWPVERR
ncbi:MAG: hypothetical protein ACYC9L_08555 [Sulfuricaulis sp.]